VLLQTTTGYENVPGGSAKSYVFTMPSTGFPIPDKETNLGVAAKGRDSRIATISAQASVQAVPGMAGDPGKWITATYDVPENRLLKIFATRNTGGSNFGSMRILASMIIRMRPGAALRRVGTILTGHARATYSRVWTEGRFDILTLAQAHALGVTVPRHFEAQFAETMVRRAFEIVVIEPETASVPVLQTRVVTTSQGQAVTVTTARRRRALDL